MSEARWRYGCALAAGERLRATDSPYGAPQYGTRSKDGVLVAEDQNRPP
jgi:hypothetical protein